MEKTYEQEMHCENCGHIYIKRFPTGERASGYHICPNCGCRDVKSLGKPKNVAKYVGEGSTPEEAVARLWLALNKNENQNHKSR